MRPFRSVFLALALTLSAIPAGAEQACASNHVVTRLGGFSEGSVSLPLYWAAENAGQATVTLLILTLFCDGSTSTANWEVQPGSATATDYSPATAPFQWANTFGHSPTQTRTVTITNDSFSSIPSFETGVETARVALTGGSNVRFEEPSSAELVILDDDAPIPTMSLVAGAYAESESTPAGGVPVFRAGNVSGPSTVNYTLGGGTATAGADYQAATTGTLTFAAGDRVEVIPVNVVDDTDREASETLDVSISGTGVEEPSKVSLEITDNEESFPPSSSLHHPNQGKKYPASKFLIREIHIFTSDEGGAGTVAAEFALRRNMKNRSCAWWTGRKFKKGKCEAERWLKTDVYETDFFYIRMPELPASVGTVKNYTAYSRAIDGAKNVESDFEVGRNANTFEIKKKK
jgi:hypothetical protein